MSGSTWAARSESGEAARCGEPTCVPSTRAHAPGGIPFGRSRLLCAREGPPACTCEVAQQAEAESGGRSAWSLPTLAAGGHAQTPRPCAGARRDQPLGARAPLPGHGPAHAATAAVRPAALGAQPAGQALLLAAAAATRPGRPPRRTAPAAAESSTGMSRAPSCWVEVLSEPTPQGTATLHARRRLAARLAGAAPRKRGDAQGPETRLAEHPCRTAMRIAFNSGRTELIPSHTRHPARVCPGCRPQMQSARRHGGQNGTQHAPAEPMAAFVSAAPAVKAPAAPVRLARSAAPASVAGRRSVRMQASYKVTLVTPEGTKEITCADDVYVLDAAEVRQPEAAAAASREPAAGPGWAWCEGHRSPARAAPPTDAQPPHGCRRRRALTCLTPAARAPAPLAPARWRCAPEPPGRGLPPPDLLRTRRLGAARRRGSTPRACLGRPSGLLWAAGLCLAPFVALTRNDHKPCPLPLRSPARRRAPSTSPTSPSWTTTSRRRASC